MGSWKPAHLCSLVARHRSDRNLWNASLHTIACFRRFLVCAPYDSTWTRASHFRVVASHPRLTGGRTVLIRPEERSLLPCGVIEHVLQILKTQRLCFHFRGSLEFLTPIACLRTRFLAYLVHASVSCHCRNADSCRVRRT